MKKVQFKEVILTWLSKAGDGSPNDPHRRILQIWDTDGNLLAERDDHLLEKMEQYLTQPPTDVEKNTVETEPPLLAAFGRKYKDGVYPNQRWCQLVYSELSNIAHEEPPCPRLTLIEEALRFLKPRLRE